MRIMAPDDQTLQNESLTRTGSLYYFEKDEEGLWEFMEKIQPVRSYGDEQFNGPGLDFNEERILIGHPSKKDITGRTIGAVYILDFLGPTASDIEGYSQEWTSNNKIDVFPNPAYSHINVEYTVVRSTPVTITIYDILGRMVAQTTVNSMVLAGKHREKIDVSSWMPGMYILQLEMHDYVVVQKWKEELKHNTLLCKVLSGKWALKSMFPGITLLWFLIFLGWLVAIVIAVRRFSHLNWIWGRTILLSLITSIGAVFYIAFVPEWPTLPRQAPEKYQHLLELLSDYYISHDIHLDVYG